MTRDLLKTGSFALLHFGVAFSVAYALTGSIAVATGIGLIEPIVNTVAFFLHERAWQRFEPRTQPIARVVIASPAPSSAPASTSVG
jgi:uncharacterized membrane protein